MKNPDTFPKREKVNEKQKDRKEGMNNMEELSIEVMNSLVYIAISNCKKTDWKANISGWFTYVDREWSRFQNGNELYQFNEAPTGAWIKVSLPFFDVLQRADFYRRQTNSYFNPLLLSQMETIGYHQSFPFNSVPVQSIVPASQGEEPFLFDATNCMVYKQTESKVDLGGIGKGYAVEAAARWLQTNGRVSFGIVDGGGDLKVWSDGEKIWNIGIADPYNDKKEIAQIKLKNGAIATSNRIYRSWIQGKEERHHILNGRTGMPARTNIVQVTVISESCLSAEVGAKIGFLQEENELKKTISEILPNSNVYLVSDTGEKKLMEWRNGDVSV